MAAKIHKRRKKEFFLRILRLFAAKKFQIREIIGR